VSYSFVSIGCALRGSQEAPVVFETGSQAEVTKAFAMKDQIICPVMVGFLGVREWIEWKE
jgi:hypothetical protein